MKNNLKELTVIMNIFVDEFCKQDYKLSDIKIQSWDEILLKPYGIEEVKKAATKLLRNHRYSGFPKISDMVAIIENRDDIEDIATSQWQVVKKNLNSYASVMFDDPVIHMCISSMGGWIRLCQMQTEEETWKEKDFTKLYKIYSKQEIDNNVLPLMGIHNQFSPIIENIKTQHPRIDFDKIGNKPNNVLSLLSKKIKEAKLV
jgi:hypothetical protein